MKFAGIIAEYDPFHNGHAWQLAQARALGAQRVRMIPYRSVGVSSGMLLAVRVDGAFICGRLEERLLVALCPGKLSANGNYTALVGADG